MIAKVFRAADTEESGTIDTSQVPTLAAKVLGSGVKESDMQLIRMKSEVKGGEPWEGSRRPVRGAGFCMGDRYDCMVP